jgi:O-antigen ligase
MLCASLISGYTLSKKIGLENTDKRLYKIIKIVVVTYLFFSLMSLVVSYNPLISLFGDNFRRNGFLTFVALSTFFLAAVKYSQFDNLDKILRRIVIIGVITASYSIIQINKKDFVKWSDPNSIISTLGNTNFAGAAMAIFAIVSFGHIFIKSSNFYYKLFNLVLCILLFYSIQKTNARQAVFIAIIGIFIIILIKIYSFNKKMGLITLLGSLPVGFLAVFGILQIGPLQNLLYKPTVTVRGYYWRAGIEMFKNHPLFGVGIDNYGKFFKEYRESGYSLKYGFGLTSTNAHNIFIQNFATGGIFVGTLYIILQLIILIRAIHLLRNTFGENQTRLSIIIAAWVAYQAQSIISIDNIGLSIWGWLLGGTILGLSINFQPESKPSNNMTNKSLVISWNKVLPSLTFFLASVIVIVPLYVGERNTLLANNYAAPKNSDPKVKELFKIYADRALSANFISNDYRNAVVTGLFAMGFDKEALNELIMINKKDPRNLDTLVLIATYYEQTGNYQEAIRYRKEIAKFDPWNAQNYLGLAQLYKVTNDLQNMTLMVDKILSFASSDPIAEVAKKEFTQTPN